MSDHSRLSLEQLAELELSLREVDEGGSASDEEVRALFAKYGVTVETDDSPPAI